MMVTNFKPNTTGTRIAVLQRFPRRIKIGEIRRTTKGLTFAAKVTMTPAQLGGVSLYMRQVK